MKKHFLTILIAILGYSSFAQELEDSNIKRLLTREFVGGVNLNTSGWGFNFEYNFQKNYKYKHSVGLTFTNIRHEKEYKIPGTSGTRGYYYGKINSLVAIRPNFGGKRLLFQSKRENGIEISFLWKAGISFGLVKPVYLEVEKSINSNFIHFPERYDPTIHFPGTIYSRSSWFKGLGQAKFEAGLFLKSGIDFNFAREQSFIAGGETGAMIDYFPSNKIEIMHEVENFNLFPSLYLQFNFGKKF